jgi:protein-S-isoprenylcysteine O-methyltransferase Ste14/membrane-associated phospholipid phosphatase/SAM-dependent methyltransferase
MIYRKLASRLSFRGKDIFFLVFILIIGLIALWSYFNLDQQVFSLLRQNPINWHSNYWIKAFRYLGRAWLPIWLLLVWFLSTGRQRPVIITLIALIIVGLMATSLKVGVRRPRPCEVLKGPSWQEEQSFLSHRLSFPSGDAAVAFTTATVIASFVTWPLACLLLAASTTVALLRVTTLAHYPSDVLAGAAIGVFAAWLAIQIERRYLAMQRPRFNLTRGMAIWGIIIIPVAFILPNGIDKFVMFLKTYGLLAVCITLSTKINLEKIYAIVNSAHAKLFGRIINPLRKGRTLSIKHEEQFTVPKPAKMAFGVELSNRTYRLRLARYQALAEGIAAFVKEQKLKNDEKLNLLDIGLGSGRSMQFIDATGVSEHIVFFGIDNSEKRLANVYSPQRWVLKRCDIEQDELPFETGMFDMIICEQVLEHLLDPEAVMQEVCRVLRPGGLAIIGTASYVPGLSLLRRFVVPLFDRLVGIRRSHQQVFSCRSFTKLIEQTNRFSIHRIRGFRTVSGGPLSWLEDFHFWYRLNRFLGRVAPWLCPDVQVIAFRTPFANINATDIEYVNAIPVREKKVRLKVAISALKRLPIGICLAALAKACQLFKPMFDHLSKVKVSYTERLCYLKSNWNERLDRILNWLRKRRTLALKIAFPIIIAENIIDGEKPHELGFLDISTMAAIGLALVIVGTLIRFLARGHFRKNCLVTTGPYALIRHPLYLGSLLVVAGVLFQLNDWLFNWSVITPLVVVFYGASIIHKERSSEKMFGRQWQSYKSKVPCIIPSLRSWLLPIDNRKWSWKVYLRTGEIWVTPLLISLPLLIELMEDFVFERMLGV